MGARIGIARRRDALDGACAEAIAAESGEPSFLGDAGSAEALVARLDALLLPGGPDFLPPSPYPAGVRFSPAAPERLAFDLKLLAAARAAGVPVLGICYGMQLLAVAAGGSLHYHVPVDVPGAREHACADPAARHPVALVAGTRLAALFAEPEIAVNSRHHQAVSHPGRGLRVAARAPDGVIEAIEADVEQPFVIGVQWHPENLGRAHRAALFGAFVEAARRARG